MKKLFTLIIIAGFILSGCGTTKFGLNRNVQVYKVEVDRVDQELRGNQGYLMGQPPAIPEGSRKTTRTMIRVDVEVPEDLYPLSTVLGIGKDLPEGEGKEPAPRRAVITEEETVEEDEGWIK